MRVKGLALAPSQANCEQWAGAVTDFVFLCPVTLQTDLFLKVKLVPRLKVLASLLELLHGLHSSFLKYYA